jgi:DNA polymerase-4
MESPKSLYVFIDLNCYFATGEQQANPRLRGKPIGVCEHSGGIILAPSREAKKFGVKTGTPVWEARKLCPGIIFTLVKPNQIRALTSRFYAIAERYSSAIEHVSVDEVSINLTGICFSWQEAVEIAQEIKKAIAKEMGEWVTASIGVAESRLVAKIATDLQKPDGLVVIADEPLSFPGIRTVVRQDLYDLLKLDDVPGIGRRTVRNLAAKGIGSLRELSQVPLEVLHAWYGVNGVWLYDLSHFQDAWRHVDLDGREAKSIGHQFSLSKKNALYDKRAIKSLLWKLSERVTTRMRKQKLRASNVSVYMRYATGGGLGGAKKIGDYTDSSLTIVTILEKMLYGLDCRKGITYVQMTVSGLSPVVEQGLLFKNYDRENKISKALDAVNDRHGELTIVHAPVLGVKSIANDTVGFGRMRERQEWGTEE